MTLVLFSRGNTFVKIRERRMQKEREQDKGEGSSTRVQLKMGEER